MQRSFYNDLECPQDEHDAKVRMQCHKHAVSDIELQKEAIESEIEIERAQDVPYNGNKLERLQEHRANAS